MQLANGTEQTRDTQGTERSADKVQKIAVAVFPQSSSSSSSSCMLYIVECCSAAVRRSSSINLGVIRRTRLWHEAHPEHKGGRGAGKPCTGLLLCNTLMELLCNQHATLHNELNSKKGFGGSPHSGPRSPCCVRGDSGPLCVEQPPVQQHFPRHRSYYWPAQ